MPSVPPIPNWLIGRRRLEESGDRDGEGSEGRDGDMGSAGSVDNVDCETLELTLLIALFELISSSVSD
jgi:hypothetical protein